jgi:hypothetical protein
VDGLGLVFNAGEVVQGYTNFLWTIWIAAGLALHVGAETWAHAWSICFYVGSILLLIVVHLRIAQPARPGALLLPVAALGAALHREWSIFATSGLETSLFTFLILIGFVLLTGNLGARAVAWAGVVFALASLTRPDGVLLTLVGGLFVLWAQRPQWRTGLSYAGNFAVVWLPYMAWQYGYYGDFFPNSYYAKSGDLAWYGQGWSYLVLYFQKYWALLAGPVLIVAAIAVSRARPGKNPRNPQHLWTPELVLSLAFALSYTFYVVRVGGDFMFARLLIPVTPYYLILLELGLQRAFAAAPIPYAASLVIALAGLWLTPCPVTDQQRIRGVADEWMFYTRWTPILEHESAVIGRYLDGLPVRVAFLGTEARMVYGAHIPIAVESETGLTDRIVAHQPLAKRGRPGHEKHASVPYLIDQRKVHFAFSPEANLTLGLDRFIPRSQIRLDDVGGRIIHWDPDIMRSLQRRGALFNDFPTELDRYIGKMDRLQDGVVANDFAKFKRFYFDHVADPRREAAFTSRLSHR